MDGDNLSEEDGWPEQAGEAGRCDQAGVIWQVRNRPYRHVRQPGLNGTVKQVRPDNQVGWAVPIGQEKQGELVEQ